MRFQFFGYAARGDGSFYETLLVYNRTTHMRISEDVTGIVYQTESEAKAAIERQNAQITH